MQVRSGKRRRDFHLHQRELETVRTKDTWKRSRTLPRIDCPYEIPFDVIGLALPKARATKVVQEAQVSERKNKQGGVT